MSKFLVGPEAVRFLGFLDPFRWFSGWMSEVKLQVSH